MDVLGVLSGFALGLASLAAFVLVIEPWARGRISSHDYHAYLDSPAWVEKCAELEARSRGRRCAVCGTTWDLAEPHHVSYRCLGNEPLWHLVRLCRQHHTGRWSVHWWSQVLFASRTRGLWFTTGMVIGWGKLRRVGRPRRRTTVTVTTPGSASEGDWLFLPDGRVMEHTSGDWRQVS